MYHPELYPEFSRNNIKIQPLVVRQDVIRNQKGDAKKKLQMEKEKDVEIRVLEKFKIEYNKRSEPSLRNTVLNSLRVSGRLNPEYYSSKFEIEPIFEEIKGYATKFFIPNFKLDNENYFNGLKYAEEAHEKGLNPFPLGLLQADENTFNIKDNLDEPLSYSSLSEIYAKHIAQNNKFDLRESMIQMKKENMMNPHIDIRGVETETDLKEGERIYFDDAISLKIEYEELLSYLMSLSESEASDLLAQFDVSTKDDLVLKIKSEISDLDKEITNRYLNLDIFKNKQSTENSKES